LPLTTIATVEGGVAEDNDTHQESGDDEEEEIGDGWTTRCVCV
jgi:hypothetical protein